MMWYICKKRVTKTVVHYEIAHVAMDSFCKDEWRLGSIKNY